MLVWLKHTTEQDELVLRVDGSIGLADMRRAAALPTQRSAGACFQL